MTVRQHSLEWTNDWSTGVTEFDADHKRLIDIYDRLFAACFAGQGPGVLLDIVNELIAYAEDHFKREEDIMLAHGFPGRDEHVKEHQALLEQVYLLRNQLKDKATHAISNEALDFLNDWIATHTVRMDTAYGPFLNARGVA